MAFEHKSCTNCKASGAEPQTPMGECHGHGTYQDPEHSCLLFNTLYHVFMSFIFVLPALASVRFCVVERLVPVLPLISILSAEKHDRIKWRSRQDGRNGTTYPATPKTDGRTAETDGGRAKAD